MWKLKSCPKCKGDLFIDWDIDGWYEECLQCSYLRYVKTRTRVERQRYSDIYRNPKKRKVLQQVFKRRGYLKFQDTTLFLTLVIWMCTVPVLAAFVLPFLGWKATAYLAGGLLLVVLVACWFLCTFRPLQKPEGREI